MRSKTCRFVGAIAVAVLGIAAWNLTFGRQPGAFGNPQADTTTFLRLYQAMPRVTVPVSSGGAVVVIVKFTDYACPSCGVTHRVYKPVLEKYEARFPGAVKLVVKNFPWNTDCNPGAGRTLHPGACDAAVAVALATEQKHGAEMEDWLYANQQILTPDTVRRSAEVIGGVRNFAARYPRAIAQVKADAALGQLLGVDSTPTFFINGVKLPGIQPELLDAAIAFELRRAGKGGA